MFLSIFKIQFLTQLRNFHLFIVTISSGAMDTGWDDLELRKVLGLALLLWQPAATWWQRECVLGCFSHIWLFATLWTVAHQAPPSMGLSRQEYWSRLHALLQGMFPTQGSNPCLLCRLHWQVGSLPSVPPGKPWWQCS